MNYEFTEEDMMEGLNFLNICYKCPALNASPDIGLYLIEVPTEIDESVGHAVARPAIIIKDKDGVAFAHKTRCTTELFATWAECYEKLKAGKIAQISAGLCIDNKLAPDGKHMTQEEFDRTAKIVSEYMIQARGRPYWLD